MLALAGIAAAGQPASTITRVEVERDADGAGAGRTVELPLNQLVPRRADDVYWFRISAQRYRRLEQPALLVTRAATNFQIYLDDEWAFGGSFDDSPMNYTWNTPFLIPLSRQALADSDFIRIGLYALAGNRVVLDPLRIAEHDALTDLHWRASWRQNRLAFAITIVALALAAISLMLWVSSGRQPLYLYGCLSAFALACSNFNFFVLHPVFEQNLWQALAHASLDWFCVFSILWMAALRQRQSFITRHIWLWGLLSGALNLLLPVSHIVPTVEILHIFSIGFFLTALIQAHNSPNIDDTENRLLLLTSVASSLMCTFDLLVQFDLLQAPNMPRLLPLMIFMVLIFYHVILLRRFLQTYRDAHRSNAQLAKLVQQKERELATQYQQMARLQAENARAAERQHIFREIHDGMGGHLVSAMALSKRASQNDAVLNALRSAHDDMRLLVDGGSIPSADLGETLGLLRPRLQPQLAAAGIELHWNVDPVAAMPVLDARQRMHVVRLLQECVTNVIKHANATLTTLSCRRRADGAIDITIIDNGRGAGIASRPDGNGLRNMQYRARQLAGEFSFTQSATGGTATLVLPAQLPPGQSADQRYPQQGDYADSADAG